MDESLRTDRRRFLARLAAGAATATLFPRLALAQADDGVQLSEAQIDEAARLAGLEFTADEKALMLENVQGQVESLQRVRDLQLANELPPAFRFRAEDGLAAALPELESRAATDAKWRDAEPADELHWADLRSLRKMLDDGDITSEELTRRTIERLRAVDEQLHCVIEFTEDRAMEEARRADQELQDGDRRGPLHGIPYGAKDILSARGAKTTWGAMTHRDQVIDDDADVVRRLAEAGAVLVAKTSVGALAWGDVWYDATTRNPWDLEQGSSGSSAGSASAVAAGGVPFAIGTETLGSLVSPATRCGVTSIRPTFGRVSRGGCMALSWTMDKIGPMARNVADCALVLEAIHGASRRDPDALDRPLRWRDEKKIGDLRIGVVRSAFEEDRPQKAIDDAVLATLRSEGAKTTDITLPEFPVWDLMPILQVEAAAAFEELTLSGRDDELVRQVEQAWPNVFRAAQLVPGVQYVQAQRARTMLMRRYEELFAEIDVFVCPSFGGDSLGATNLTGHPVVVLPNGFTEDGHPTSISFTGALFREGDAALVAHRYQAATDWHRRHPAL